MEVVMVVAAAVALFIAASAAIAMVITAVVAGAVVTPPTTTVMGIAERVTQDVHLLDALASTPIPMMLMVLMLTGCLATITELMLDLNMLLIVANL
ncbi:hypothetical protein ACYZTX_13720 [Pseudomonas sp. MDT1-17]